MQAYLNDESVKQFYLERMQGHMEADELVRGVTWETNGESRGCAVGCTLHAYDHAAYETELGWPEWLARLEDGIFESTSAEYAKTFPARLMEAVPIGFSDWDRLRSRFLLFLLQENISRVSELQIDNGLKKQVVDAIQQCADLHQGVIDGDQWDESAARSAALEKYADKLIALFSE